MDLDNLDRFHKLDPQGMLAEIDSLPNQLESAWSQGQSHELPPWRGIRQVLVAGMGGSAMGADLLASYAAPYCAVPIIVHRDYDLPVWARRPETLVIVSSHSGNTEETLSAFEQATNAGCHILAVTTGGSLAERAQTGAGALLRFEHKGQPRAAIGYSFGLLLAAFVQLGLLPDPTMELRDTIAAMRAQQGGLRAEVPVVQNPAKRMAGQLMGRWVAVFGSGVLAPVARRWKGQISEIAKTWAQFEFLPEADHNSLAGIFNPEELFARTMMIFLQSPTDHPRNPLRTALTRTALTAIENFKDEMQAVK